MPEKPPVPVGADAAADDGFTIESHSVPQEPVPLDTTEKHEYSSTTAATDGVREPGDPPDADGTTTESEGTDATADKAAASPAAKPPKKGTIERRTAALTKDIDALTAKRTQAQQEYQQEQTRLATLRAEAAAVEAKLKPPAPPAAAAPLARPDHPQYKDFETDEQYDAAVAAWRTKDQQWLDARDKALEDRITSGVDSRLQRQREAATAEEADAALVSRLDVAREAHPDWNEKVEPLKDLQSSWYDKTQHGKATAYFLSDIGQNAEDGPEFLYWLGTVALEDPDRAQRLADLLPTKALRDVIILSSPQKLMEHFSSDEGVKEFNLLKAMHPDRMKLAVGALSARLSAADRGPAGLAPPPITKATPSAKPPAGAPPNLSRPAATGKAPPFLDWMAQEDEKERRQKILDMGGASA